MIIENLLVINEKIHAAAKRAGRDPEDIALLAVSKRKSENLINEVFAAGQVLFGENYLQDAQVKIKNLTKEISWHFIGGIQSNKVKLIADLFDTVETVDRLKVARLLNKHLRVIGKIMPIYIQVNIGREPQKSGILPENVSAFFQEVCQYENLLVKGLMAMPPYNPDPEKSRPFFRGLKALRDGIVNEQNAAGKSLTLGLSMGMSGDFEVAIEEGATLVRVGTALFGARD